MDIAFSLSGQIRGLDFPHILFNIHKKSISGVVEIKTAGWTKRLVVQNQKIVLAMSDSEKDSLKDHLLRGKTIDKATAQEASDLMAKKGVRFGRALIELGRLDYEQLWQAVRDQMRAMVFSLFDLENGDYEIDTGHREWAENIVLDEGIQSVIIGGMRRFDNEKLLYKRLKDLHQVYVYKPDSIERAALKPHEIHVLDLVGGESQVKEIIKKSELLKFDTLRVLFTLLVLEALSTEKVDIPPRRRFKHQPADRSSSPEHDAMIPGSSFMSFDEALGYFNMKYEMIYKILSKEIGPIALSILSKAIEDISEKLPFFMKKVTLDSDGCVKKNPILKSVWYYDVDRYIGEFVKGLEEILYAEIYAVKKHLGIDYEQQILKWIN